ncbi:MAG: sulfatase-like hydrolase/transferase [Caldilineaceae bacterium]|nr:sulfatase-like hydrolase/transferase [Caldilineaceae bacterium]
MTTQPNILLISTDHWPAALLGATGHPVIQTPTLDELARSGVRFTNAYAECPVCIPARRTLMTGTPPRTHGDRVFDETLPMPNLPTLAQTLRDAGYQAYAVGKLHVYPQRNRIGFDDVILDEEGRQQYGVIDDYELFLGDRGHPGAHFDHGMSNNEYSARPWHLDEALHATNWASQQMVRTIKRRDPKRPGFWYLSYRHPHPPLVPLQAYLDLYRDVPMDEPHAGAWVAERGNMPYRLQANLATGDRISTLQATLARRAFYALCTHIDHQLRMVIGALREEGLLNDTILCFTSDHGDMLGNHGLWAKRLFYEYSANIPMILLGVAGDERVGYGRVDNRLVGWQDVMPTLLDLAGVPIPPSVEGLSMVGERRRDWFYGEIDEGPLATRMIHNGRYKLVYYAAGNVRQLFDLETDPNELTDLAANPEQADTLARLTGILVGQLYGGDEGWVQQGELVGLPNRVFTPGPNRGLSSQRSSHWPPPPVTHMRQVEWYPEKGR